MRQNDLVGVEKGTFTLFDLDLVLYGAVKPQDENQGQGKGHAISCLSLSHLKGMDKMGETSSSNTRHRSQCPPTPDVMLLDLPDGFSINQTSFGGCTHYGVFSQRDSIASGTRFGPFQGRQVNPSEIKTNDDNTFMWEIFKDNKLSHFIDGRGSNGNWLAYVNCARNQQEQNLISLQENGLIFYEVCKEIKPGDELLVWYGDEYAQTMGIPVGLKGEAAAMEISPENEDNGSDSE